MAKTLEEIESANKIRAKYKNQLTEEFSDITQLIFLEINIKKRVIKEEETNKETKEVDKTEAEFKFLSL